MFNFLSVLTENFVYWQHLKHYVNQTKFLLISSLLVSFPQKQSLKEDVGIL